MDIINITARDTRTIQNLFADADHAPLHEEIACRAAYAIHCEDRPHEPWVVLETVCGEQYWAYSADAFEVIRSLRFEELPERVPFLLARGRAHGVESEYLMRCDAPFIPQLKAKKLAHTA